MMELLHTFRIYTSMSERDVPCVLESNTDAFVDVDPLTRSATRNTDHDTRAFQLFAKYSLGPEVRSFYARGTRETQL